MRNRYMRLVVFFDLPIDTEAERKSYRLFRKFLIKEGFIMMQKSVYSKMVLDGQMASSAITRLTKEKPSKGLVQVLKVTEKQYASIVEIVGEKHVSNELDDSNRLVML